MKSDDGKSPSLRNRVHHANGVVWEAVSPRCSRRRRVRRRRRVQPPPRRRASPPPPPARSGGRRSRRCRSPAGPRRCRSPGRCSGCRTCVGVGSAGVGGQTRSTTMRYLMRRDRYFDLHRLRGGDARMRGASSETRGRSVRTRTRARSNRIEGGDARSSRGRPRESEPRRALGRSESASIRFFRARSIAFSTTTTTTTTTTTRTTEGEDAHHCSSSPKRSETCFGTRRHSVHESHCTHASVVSGVRSAFSALECPIAPYPTTPRRPASRRDGRRSSSARCRSFPRRRRALAIKRNRVRERDAIDARGRRAARNDDDDGAGIWRGTQ